MSKKKSIGIQPGDEVRITRPEFFARCGYPLSFRGEVGKLLADRRPEIVTFLRQMGVHDDMSGNQRAVEKVAMAVAYEVIRQNQFGGSERRIHTRWIHEYAGRHFVVRGVRFVKTGLWSRGAVGYEDGPDPNYLSNERTHRILDTGIWHAIDDNLLWPVDSSGFLEIQADCVELVRRAGT